MIERDALNDTTWQAAMLPVHDHAADEIETFAAVPRTDHGLIQKMLTWWKSELKPGMHVVSSPGQPQDLRYMFLITSNAYQDRENETITSAALKAYEESCYPGEGLFHCDNKLLWWHDPDVVMGDIVAVNYSEPFLIEVAREAPTAMAKVLWDFAEQNGDKAGASHLFGYLKRDKQLDGTYTRIFKQETTYLPDRPLAANARTYAGVLTPMASAQSDQRLNDIFKEATGIENAAELIHAKSGELEKKLAALGHQHKARKASPEAGADTEMGDMAGEDTISNIPVAEFVKLAKFVAKLQDFVMQLVDGQEGLLTGQAALEGTMKSLTEMRTAEKAHTTSLETRLKTQDDLIKALTQRLDTAEKHLSLAPRSVQTQPGESAEAVKAAVDQAQKAREDDSFEEVRGWGKLKPAPKYD